jgi:hypothetical protein
MMIAAFLALSILLTMIGVRKSFESQARSAPLPVPAETGAPALIEEELYDLEQDYAQQLVDLAVYYSERRAEIERDYLQKRETILERVSN